MPAGLTYTLTNLQDDIRNYTEVGDTVFSTAVLSKFIINAENRIYRSFDADLERFYATSTCQIGKSTFHTRIHEIAKKRLLNLLLIQS